VPVAYSGSKFKTSYSFPIGGGHSQNLAHSFMDSFKHDKNRLESCVTQEMSSTMRKLPLRGEYQLWVYKRF